MKAYYATSPFESWTQVTGIVQKPYTSKRLGVCGDCTLTILDVDFALFDDWEPRDNDYKIKVTDDDENQIFIGYLDGKKFTRNRLTLQIKGFSSVLDGEDFNGNYIRYSGVVKTVPYDFDDEGSESTQGLNVGVGNANALGMCKNGNNIHVVDTDNHIYRYDLSFSHDINTDATTVGIVNPWYITADGTYLYVVDTTTNDITKLSNSHAYQDTITPTNVTTIRALCFAEGLSYVIDADDYHVHVYDSTWTEIEGLEVDLSEIIEYPSGFDFFNGIFYITSDVSDKIYMLDRSFNLIEDQDLIINSYGVFCDGKFLYVSNNTSTLYRYFLNGVALDDKYALELEQPDESAWTWENDYGYSWLVKDEQNLAILIRDTVAPEDTAEFTCSNITLTGHDTHEYGDKDSLDEEYDDDFYKARQYIANTGNGDFDLNTAITLSSTVDKDKTIKNIRLNWNIGLRVDGIGSWVRAYLEIYNYTTEEWDLIFMISDGTDTWQGFTSKSSDLYSETSGFILSTDYLDGDVDNWTTVTLRIRSEGISDINPNFYDITIDYLVCSIDYDAQYFSPIMKKIIGNGDEYVVCDFDWTQSGVAGGNAFDIGYSSRNVLSNIMSVGTPLTPRYLSNLTKYQARKYLGDKRIAALNSICLLEGLLWSENHNEESILLFKKDDAEDSTVELTADDVDGEIEYDDQANHYKEVVVLGNEQLEIVSDRVFNDDESKYTYDPASTSKKVKVIKDTSILTKPDATEVAIEQFAVWRYKQPSIMVNTHKEYYAVEGGQTVNITFEDLGLSDINLIVRRIDTQAHGYDKDGNEIIKNTMYLGLGSTPQAEKLDNWIREAKLYLNSIYSKNRLNAQASSGTLSISSSQITDFVAAVQALIEAYGYAVATTVNSALAIGSANHAWIGCPFELETNTTTATNKLVKQLSGSYENIGSDDGYLMWAVPLPTNIGGLKLYIDGFRIDILDADANNEVTRVWLRGIDYDSLPELAEEVTDRESQGSYDTTFTAIDCSSYKRISLECSIACLNAAALNICSVEVRYYYG